MRCGVEGEVLVGSSDYGREETPLTRSGTTPTPTTIPATHFLFGDEAVVLVLLFERNL